MDYGEPVDYEGRPETDEYGAFAAGYVSRVPEGGLVGLLRTEGRATVRLLEGLSEAEADHAYAPGKWTIKEVVGHLTDAERVFAYRALRFGRGDETELAGMDENAYVPPARFGDRTLRSLLGEFEAVRGATVRLFAGLPPEAWLHRGVASGALVSVRALACIIVGHERHHRAVLEERYLAPLRGGGSSRG